MPRPSRRLLPPTVVPAAIRQISAVVAIGAIGAGALAATGTTGVDAAAPSAAGSAVGVGAQRQDAGRPLPTLPTPAAARRTPASAAKPATHQAVAKPATTEAMPAARYIPSGTGMWIYQWNKSNGGDARKVVARTRATGLTHLFVRTGSSHDGYTGTGVLGALLPATAHTDIKVVAWDFPELKHPYFDAKRLARAAWQGRSSRGPRVAAVAPDIETEAEGTHTSAKRVTAYLAWLRYLLPQDVSILTTVPWPSTERVGRYPYKAVAARSDALLPMAYWYDNSPTHVTAKSISFLRRYHRPVEPVGQGYDGKLDVPSLPHNNLRKQMPMFFVTARAMGARAVSIWSWQAAPPIAWAYLDYAAKNHWFPVKG
ncbi:MAG: hypothetical protein ACTHMZ_08055 [Actinomycetes bacterium]